MTVTEDVTHGPVRINLLFNERPVRVPYGVTLFDAASWNGIAIDSTCGGHGTCKKCRIRIADDPAEGRHRGRRPAGHLAPGSAEAVPGAGRAEPGRPGQRRGAGARPARRPGATGRAGRAQDPRPDAA